MVRFSKESIQKVVFYPLIGIFIVSCSLGTSFKYNEIRSFKGTLIPELSNEPILIEKISTDLIKSEQKRIPLNLPLSLLNYSPESYKIGIGDVLFIYVYGETERNM